MKHYFAVIYSILHRMKSLPSPERIIFVTGPKRLVNLFQQNRVILFNMKTGLAFQGL